MGGVRDPGGSGVKERNSFRFHPVIKHFNLRGATFKVWAHMLLDVRAKLGRDQNSTPFASHVLNG